ncbi:FkbM family methyltransferase [Rhizobium sp. HT1-10]|uniref:FkbM family methyltransferase n=1 Tax=Rhizobium sp. HT1-10 TaxID=3111638 RepID=UPI003C1579C5
MNDLPYTSSATKKTASKYGEISYFSNDSGAIRLSLEHYGEWAENEISFMKTFLRKGGTVVDVGAYLGTHTLAFADAVGENGHVVSIEAQQKSWEILQANVSANGLKNVRVENAIAGEQVDFRDLVAIDPESAESFGSTSIVAIKEHSDTALKVRTISIDSLQIAQCDLIKIDVEGMEEEVLKGSVKTLAQLRPTIYAECNSLDDGLRTVALLKGMGYTTFAHVVDAFNPQNFNRNENDIFRGAREVAIVGAIDQNAEVCRAYSPRKCELLLNIETADDLALAMMNKPQYAVEILREGAASRSGGNAILDQWTNDRLDLEACRTDVTILRSKAIADGAEKHQLQIDTAWLKNDVEDLKRQIASLGNKVIAEKRERTDLSFQLKKMDHELGNLELQGISLRRQLADREDQKQRDHARIRALQDQIEIIYRSRSWRLTSPIRLIVILMKRYIRRVKG